MSKIQFGVLVFPGTNCDSDSLWAVQHVAGHKARYVWHTDSNIDDCEVIVIPGGFSYGDYLRSGAIAKISPVLKSVVRHAEKGKPVIGICNGFQILAETSLVRGAFLRNKGVHFLCQEQYLKVVDNQSLFTSRYQIGELVEIPIAHGEGNYFLNPEDLAYTLDNGLIAFQYCDKEGNVNDETNPNGSTHHIAGVFNKGKNVLGMMPHPERASENEIGSVGGLGIWQSIGDALGLI